MTDHPINLEKRLPRGAGIMIAAAIMLLILALASWHIDKPKEPVVTVQYKERIR